MAAGNSVNDEIREQQRKVLAEQGIKGKFQYFSHYYKWHLIIGIIVVIIIGSIAHDIITKKDVVLQVAYINGFPNVENVEFMADFSRTLGIDEKKEETLLDTSLYISSDSSSV